MDRPSRLIKTTFTVTQMTFAITLFYTDFSSQNLIPVSPHIGSTPPPPGRSKLSEHSQNEYLWLTRERAM